MLKMGLMFLNELKIAIIPIQLTYPVIYKQVSQMPKKVVGLDQQKMEIQFLIGSMKRSPKA